MSLKAYVPGAALLAALLCTVAGMPATAQITPSTDDELNSVPPQFNDLVFGRSDKMTTDVGLGGPGMGAGGPGMGAGGPGMGAGGPGPGGMNIPAEPVVNPSKDPRDFRGTWSATRGGGGGPGGNSGGGMSGDSSAPSDPRPGTLRHATIDAHRMCYVDLGVNGSGGKIYQTADQLTIVGSNELRARRIYIGGKADPNAPLTYNGQSVAHWEGDTLVVETTRIKPSLITSINFDVQVGAHDLIISNPTLSVVERFRKSADGQQLIIDQVWTDPAVNAAPYSRTLTWSFAKDGPLFDQECEITGDRFGPEYDKETK